jgi:hypothetical protein
LEFGAAYAEPKPKKDLDNTFFVFCCEFGDPNSKIGFTALCAQPRPLKVAPMRGKP